jgi:plasmid stability protein
MQYTIRNIPEKLDRRLREVAEASDRSMNSVVIDLLHERLFGARPLPEPPAKQDLSEFRGMWRDDPWLDDFKQMLDDSDAASRV